MYKISTSNDIEVGIEILTCEDIDDESIKISIKVKGAEYTSTHYSIVKEK